MTSRRIELRAVLACAAVVTIWIGAWLTIQLFATASPMPRSAVALAAAIDCVATAGLAMYVLAIRGGRLPRWALGVTLATGVGLARVFLARVDDPTRVVTAAMICFELGMLVLLIVRGRRIRTHWRSERAAGHSALEALTAALVAVRIPARVASVVATELVLLGTVVTGWRRPVARPTRFTTHRATGWPLYAGVLIFLVLVETTVLHLVLAAYVSVLVAWLMTAMSVYSALWLVGDVLALRHGGVVIGERELELRIGVRWRGRIPWAAIASIEEVDGAPEGAIDASVLGANVVLRLHAPHPLLGLFGRRREGTVIALSIDEREAFVAAARAATLRT
ncbi:MAG: hypothetical protein IPQ07_18940 [Myxococcales bacterium]|nr:hypothetical protein [Myxococcales bacterium]